MESREILALAAAVIICLSAGAIGSIFTFSSIPTWYAGLQKPDLAPPNWVFGPVWTTLYVMMGVSAFMIYRKGTKHKAVRQALAVFGVQLALNALWSILFFGMQSPLYGLVCIAALWLSIAACIAMFWKLSKPAAYLLVPYILWVSFASLLNFWIWQLNP